MIAPGTYVVVGENYGWKSFTLHTDGSVEFVDARDGHISTWGTKSPQGATWHAAMKKWLVDGKLRKEEDR